MAKVFADKMGFAGDCNRGKAIGAMKRSAVGEEFRSNYSLGGE